MSSNPMFLLTAQFCILTDRLISVDLDPNSAANYGGQQQPAQYGAQQQPYNPTAYAQQPPEPTPAPVIVPHLNAHCIVNV